MRASCIEIVEVVHQRVQGIEPLTFSLEQLLS